MIRSMTVSSPSEIPLYSPSRFLPFSGFGCDLEGLSRKLFDLLAESRWCLRELSLRAWLRGRKCHCRETAPVRWKPRLLGRTPEPGLKDRRGAQKKARREGRARVVTSMV